MAMEARRLDDLDICSPLAQQWEKLVLENPASGFMQSIHWSRFKRQMGFNTIHFGVFRETELIGGAIFYLAPDCKGVGLLAAPDGPVLPWHDNETASLAMALLEKAIESESGKLGIMAIRIAPRLAKPRPDFLSKFATAPISLTEHKTMYLDLRLEPAELLARMKPKARYNISLARRKGVSIVEDSSASAARKFFAVMQSVSARDHFSSEPLSYFIGLLNSLCEPQLAKVFFAEHEGDVLGALLLLSYGTRSTYLYGGTTDCKRNLMGGYALQWAAINAARERGSTAYDLWGYDESSHPENTYAGFSRFKSQFCGEQICLVGTMDYYLVDRLADAVIRAINELQVQAP